MTLAPNNGLWVITTYFNPVGYRLRHQNYHIFRQMLGSPLLTVELSYSGRFELAETDADIIARYTASDVLWQKERLLNLALRHLPEDCEIVAWIDADVLFTNPGWSNLLHQRMQHADVLQLFGEVYHLPRGVSDPTTVDWTTLGSETSVMKRAETTGDASIGAPGLAWAAKRAIVDHHGIFDFCIMGGSDTAWAYAMLGDFEHAKDRVWMTPALCSKMLRWAEPLHKAVGDRVGYLDQPAFHLWHGNLEDRAYLDRHVVMHELGYDPARDIRLADNGVWEWHQASPEMRRHVANYFQARREDGP